jgi:Zn-dependent M28 family amino/carboxypeptidase
MRHPTKRPGVLVLSAILLIAAFAPGVSAANPKSEIEQTRGFRNAVTLAGIREHQTAFQAHADANGGNRVASSAAYEASANYVAARMTAAGYVVTSQSFTFPFNADLTPPVFSQVSPATTTYVDGVDFSSMTFSPNGDETAALVAVDLSIGDPAASTSGCEAADFAGFPAGAIALMQRGTCTFAIKAQNASDAGAVAAVVFNQGSAPDRFGMLSGTLSAPVGHSVQIIGTTFALGVTLANGVSSGPTGATVRVRVDRINETRTTRNVMAETPGGDPNHVVVIGAHLDSVSRGPGINDNGSGSGAILEIAEVFATQERAPRNKLRFMWYGAEEFGLLGSEAYVASLSQAQLDQIELMLNFDMVGSPNFVRFVYDGDNSAFPVGPGAAAGPPGSAELERVFTDYFASQSLASEETAFSGRSDYGPFIEQGIPAGGLFTGAEGIKTVAQAATYGGTAGTQYDPCYHLACDTLAGTNTALALTGLDQMSDAAAHAVLLMSKRNFDKLPLSTTSPEADASLQRSSVGGATDAPAPAADDHEPVDR